jgi:hypothetical protein
LKRQELISEALRYLAYLKSQVEIANSLNLTDINKHAEDFYRELLNLVYGYDLKNINIEEQNATAIDLGDEKQKIAIQVTSTQSLEKIKKTFSSFIGKKLNEKYDRLVVLNIREKLNHRTKAIGKDGEFQFKVDEDLWDVSTLLKNIGSKDVAHIQQVVDFLKANIKLSAGEKLSKEITTFVRLVELLSDDTQPLAGKGYKEEPDPEGKIDHRFAEHAAFLKSQYTDLYTEYGAVLSDVMGTADLGHAKIRRLGLYLMTFSDQKLSQNNGDAKLAIDALVDHYAGILANHAVEYEAAAIRFFIIDQLIKCNVFPNKEAVNA